MLESHLPGRLRLAIRGQAFGAGKEDAWTVAFDPDYGGYPLVDTVALGVFSQVRD